MYLTDPPPLLPEWPLKRMIGCQMTVDLFGFKHEDFLPEVKEYVGAATFLPMARDADVSLFI